MVTCKKSIDLSVFIKENERVKENPYLLDKGNTTKIYKQTTKQ